MAQLIIGFSIKRPSDYYVSAAIDQETFCFAPGLPVFLLRLLFTLSRGAAFTVGVLLLVRFSLVVREPLVLPCLTLASHFSFFRPFCLPRSTFLDRSTPVTSTLQRHYLLGFAVSSMYATGSTKLSQLKPLRVVLFVF